MADRPVLRVGARTGATLVVASAAGVVMFCWPLFVHVDPATTGHTADAPLLFILVLPIVVAVVLAQFAEGGMDAKALAMLGVLSAVNAALRPLGAGLAGIETVFFLLVIAGRVFGAGFGFVLGCTSLFASALLTAGVGPWLPFQMMASAWIGLGAGLLPQRVSGRLEVAMLVTYAVVVSYGFGFLMNLWSWPFALGYGTDVSFVPGDPLSENLGRFMIFVLSTSTWGWDTGRAITNALLILLLGPALLATLRRTSRRSSFGAAISFAAPDVRQATDSSRGGRVRT